MDHYFAPFGGDGDGSDGLSTVIQPSNSPIFTGSLKLSQVGVRRTARRLTSLPGGIHFRKLSLTHFHGGDLPLVTELVEGFSHTLESLDVAGSSGCTSAWYSRPYQLLTFISGKPWSGSLDLSGTTKLRDVTFRLDSLSVEWVMAALQTIKPKPRDLRQIAIYMPRYLAPADPCANIRQSIGEASFGQWLDLDHLLVELWESHSVHSVASCVTRKGKRCDERGFIGSLLPEITRRGVIHPTE